jgi:hypothetical protein
MRPGPHIEALVYLQIEDKEAKSISSGTFRFGESASCDVRTGFEPYVLFG